MADKPKTKPKGEIDKDRKDHFAWTGDDILHLKIEKAKPTKDK